MGTGGLDCLQDDTKQPMGTCVLVRSNMVIVSLD